jgi:ferredoxin--NADP+ reductase
MKRAMKILEKFSIAENLTKFVIESPLIAAKARPGQFILLMVKEEGERIPLTIVDSNPANHTITIIFQQVGYTTKLLGKLEPGDSLYSLVGPLGKPTHIQNYGHVVAIGGGVGIAELLPVVKALKEAGCHVTSILGGRTADLVILRDEIGKHSDELVITTDDGSLGEKGLVTDALAKILGREQNVGLVFCVGPLPMMKAVSRSTKAGGIKTLVCLNALMVDGTGMCGGCRVTVGGKTQFCCVDGPDFDGHGVDFEEIMNRQKRFAPYEQRALEKMHDCLIGRNGGK